MQMPLSFLKGLLGIGFVGKIILILSSLVTLSLGIWLFTKYYQAAKLQKIIMQELPFEKFYQIGLNALTKKQYQIATITQKFNLFPHMGVPNTKDIKEDYVINFYENNINYSFGTLTRREVIGWGKDEEIIYTRYPYLKIDVKEMPGLVATIKAMQTFLKIFKTRDNTTLESTEFEKMFAVNANDQILIWKLLTPKVIVNLIELAKEERKIPTMHFDDGYLTIVFDNYFVNSFDDPKGRLLGFYFIGTYQDILTNIIEVIQQDVELLLTVLQWVLVYDFKQ
ncbi:DUF3137 domain-containing protein [Spiroplasma sp. ChiS]|uniref:DUF3137 domain-containing protein n=1 Tax=Spiroplasma sp. ChiS TaxID=2099885 RepID=UPI001F3A36D3|nr:DUF3137 domain-containing protein [Spiroplasma sp. ChiS]